MNHYFTKNFRKTGAAIRYSVLSFVLLSFVFACKKSGTTSTQSQYDPSLPVVINSFTPDSGGIRTKIVINGSNFGSDKTIVKVFFTDKEKDRVATVVGVNNEIIYCLVPKQNGGINNIKVSIGTTTTVATKTFLYTVAQSVSNIVGVTGVAGSINGSLSDGRIQRTFGIAALGNDELITFETLSSSVRYISVTDNKVTTLQTGFDGTQPALNAARTKMYSIGRAAPHKVYAYQKSNLWQPQILSAQIPAAAGLIFAAALDDTEQWLYFRDKNGVFGRLEIANPTNIQVLNPTCGTAGSTDYSYMCYSKVDDCFYFTVQSINGIYKVSKDGKTVEEYAGFNGLGQLDAPRHDASFNSIAGICTDSEGNIYVVDSNTNLVRKINRKSGYVSTIAGIAGVFGGANGAPMASSFNYPYCIQTDKDDNIFIGESWGCTVRKLAIE
jgi:hypothetical protein